MTEKERIQAILILESALEDAENVVEAIDHGNDQPDGAADRVVEAIRKALKVLS